MFLCGGGVSHLHSFVGEDSQSKQKTLLGTSASLLVTSALLVGTMFTSRNNVCLKKFSLISPMKRFDR